MKKSEARLGLVTFVIAAIFLGVGYFSSLKFFLVPGWIFAVIFMLTGLAALAAPRR